jgi:small subunit ribosomal protein S13
LRKIKGIGFMYANTICYCTNIDKKKITGQMNDSEIQKIEDVLRNPKKYNIPVWMFNRKKDYETGENFHLIGTDLNLAVDNDMKNMKKIKSYKGIRHMQGQPVRGQRTKSNFRKNKGKVSLGVVKKRVGAPAPEEKEKKGKK